MPLAGPVAREWSDAVVVGGGPAGAAVAALLARSGRVVALFERDLHGTDKVCGEFVSQDAAAILAALGVDLTALGAVPIAQVRLISGRLAAAVHLPFPAFGLPRRVLDAALLDRAVSAGVTVHRGRRVLGIERLSTGWAAVLPAGARAVGKELFVATGKHELRGLRRRGLHDDLVAFKLHLRLEPAQHAALDRTVELVLFDGGYAGLQPVGAARANLCLVVARRRLPPGGAVWERLIEGLRAECPHLDERLAGAEPCWPRPLALARIPYGHLCLKGDGCWYLGDQAAVIPSFAGDGVAIALHSAMLAAEHCLAGKSAAAFQRRLARDLAGQVLLATGLSHGLVRARWQRPLVWAALGLPGAVSWIAARTRVPRGGGTHGS